ncbi:MULTISPECIES: phosphosulfolactate synthase [unclassified Streptomyces]|uniref:phosphosulfolactate synthase n=1 Tax=unclassified Streptomyces TaxID=2593676 RepID=UPI002E0D9C04|nr:MULTISPECIES: phosphosulfolactate synthase [unclassified Streptomyces]WSR29108.1 phosphosulfolactate synthase [Streptomyces sp. NBC_01205]
MSEANGAQSPQRAFLASLGVVRRTPRTYPFDPGYDVATVVSHIAQSHSLMAGLKLSMATWLLIEDSSLQQKIRAARDHGLAVTVGGGMFEIAADLGRLDEYLDLCRRLSVTGIEAGQGFTRSDPHPGRVLEAATARGLTVTYEIGGKHDGAFDEETTKRLIAEGGQWLNEGATHLVVEGRENAADVGLFDSHGQLSRGLADTLADEFGLDRLIFEAPTKSSQFALLDHFGAGVALGNVRLEELLRVETYRHGLHSDAYERSFPAK